MPAFAIISLIILLLSACHSSNGPEQSADRLHEYAENGDLLKVQAFLKDNPEADILDECQWSPLMKAAQYGHKDIVNVLLLQGADVQQQDKGDYTPLLLAASTNRAEIVKILIQQGARINHQENTMGWTALIWASKSNHVETVNVLLQHQADQTITDFSGKTARDWAVKNAHQRVVALFDSL